MKVDLILLILYAAFTITVGKPISYYDIFPNDILGYVVTSQPYARVRIYTPRPTLTPTNPFLSASHQPVYHHTINHVSDKYFVTKYPLLVTEVLPEEQIPKQIIDKNVIDKNFQYINLGRLRTSVQNNKDFSAEDSEEYTTDISEIDEIAFQNDNDSDQNKITSDLDSIRIRRMSPKDSPPFNHWSTINKPNITPDVDYEQIDKDEFIFVKDDKRKYSSDLLYKKTLPVKDDVEVSTGVTSEDKTQPRLKRSDNVIEEESNASTMFGFKYTTWNPRISEHLIFKNIHA